jgi:hypothetical protein
MPKFDLEEEASSLSPDCKCKPKVELPDKSTYTGYWHKTTGKKHGLGV